MLSPETIAKRIVEDIPYTHPEIVDTEALAAIVAAAVRHAYERAAEIVDAYKDERWTDVASLLETIAEGIRELKEAD